MDRGTVKARAFIPSFVLEDVLMGILGSGNSVQRASTSQLSSEIVAVARNDKNGLNDPTGRA